MNSLIASLNGNQMPLSDAKVSVLDRGFLFGDGVYEVARIYRGRIFQIEKHFERLERSLRGLRIGPVNLDQMRRTAESLVANAQISEAILYIQITRGVAESRSHTFPDSSTKPTELLYVAHFDDASASRMRAAGATGITFPDIRWSRCDLKTVNLLGNLLAAQAAKESGAYEALLFLPNGEITEGSRTNAFAVINGILRTMPLSESILPGVTRNTVIGFVKLPELDIKLEERAFTVEELQWATEVFVSGTTSEVMPIVQVDGRPVGNGHPGPITLKLAKKFTDLFQQPT